MTVSEFLKQQIVEWFGVDPARVAVVGNGVDAVFFAAGETNVDADAAQLGRARPPGAPQSQCTAGPAAPPYLRIIPGPETHHLPPTTYHPPPAPGPLPLPPSAFSLQPSAFPYLLAVGGLNFLDGGDRVIALAQEIQRRHLDLRIKVAGCQHEPGMAERAMGTGVMDLLGYVPADQLAGLMRDAVALYFPTRYETFGMAAAEAMAVGTPVVTCRSTAVPEIVGDAGIYVDPDDPKQAMDAIQSVWNDLELRKVHIARGRQRAAAHTWGACVERLVRELGLRM